MYATRFYKTLTGKSITITFNEKDLKNTVGSIIPMIAGDSYDPDYNDYRIIVMGKKVPENTPIIDHLNSTRMIGTIHFVECAKPIMNKWQALSLERYTDMPKELIKIIITYSAEIPSVSIFFNSISPLTNNTKASLSTLFSAC